MAFYGPKIIDDIRAALPVLQVVQSREKLRKDSAHEWRGIDDTSMTVNSQKNVWTDWSSQKSGDVFEYLQYRTNCTFQQAVEQLAGMAGVHLDDVAAQSPPPRRANGTGRKFDQPNADQRPERPEQPDPPPHPGHGVGQSSGTSGRSGRSNAKVRREITKTYDYVDPDGGLVYQVCRQEWLEDGDHKKTFSQRRKANDGAWAWGLKAGTYVKIGDAWFFGTKNVMDKFGQNQKVDLDDVAIGLYRFDELREAAVEAADEHPLVIVGEGEKDIDTAVEWGFVATTNSGGAGNWQPHHAQELRDCDVVIIGDNDAAGKKRNQAVAISLRGIAHRVRILSWVEVWLTAPDGGDLTDWKERANGNREKLCALIDRLKEWTPEAPDSSFSAQRFIDLDKPAKELEWLIKGVLTRGHVSIWYGQWGSGKSFLVTDAALAIARGSGGSWMGCRIHHPGLVIYQAGEGGTGLRQRLRAYRKAHHIPAGDDIPFVLLPTPIDIFSNDVDVDKLIAEIKAWAAFYDQILQLVVIDTLNMSAPGADENSAKDIGPVIARARRISMETGAHVLLVDHTPKDGGSPRGWSGKLGNVDNAVQVWETERVDRQLVDDGSHTVMRKVRSWKVIKMKDGPSGLSSEFVLKEVILGTDRDGDEITSCVVTVLNDTRLIGPSSGKPDDDVPAGYAKLHPSNEDIMRALVIAIRKFGGPAPSGIEAPLNARAVKISHWQDELIEFTAGHQDVTDTLKQRIKKRIQRACTTWMPDKLNFVGKHKDHVWRSTRKIHKIDDPPVKLPEPEPPILAPGEDPDDLLSFAENRF